MEINLRPIGFVRGGRTEPVNDDWDSVSACIELDANWLGEASLLGLDSFSHAEVIYHFHKTDPATVVTTARHPRNNQDWPLTSIFAQRGHYRPNLLGITTCHVLGVDGTTVHVRGLDAIDGTPVLDIKPYMTEFAPRGEIREPDWAHDLMADYWQKADEGS
jgi:tRNA-Thr(GGU) m(6)t(6)A37 methyltransferase TsaA